MEYLLRALFVCGGILLFYLDFRNYTRKKLLESFEYIWFALSILMVVFGLVGKGPFVYAKVNILDIIVLFFICYFIILVSLYCCIVISDLHYKNRELAMQVSLLNQENHQIMKRLEELTNGEGKDETEEKEGTICH